MNRIIKFRLYDDRIRKFRFFPEQYPIISEKKLYEFLNWENIQQFTGLTDKNSTEMYEGDIVKINDGHNSIVKIYFQDGCYFIGEGNDDQLYNWNNEAEVIGNIFENSKLLNEKV